MRRICVFAGSRLSPDPAHASAARALAAAISEAGLGAVTGGGAAGMMGVFAAAMLACGGEIHGVIPRFMVERELAHRSLCELHVVETMAERKEVMARLSSAFVALPGGVGTLDEVFEMLTARQLGLTPHPVALFDVDRYFAPTVAQLEAARDHGYLEPADLDALIVAADARTLVEHLQDALAQSR